MQRFEVLLEKISLADNRDRIVKREGEELIKVNLMTSAVASFYEKIRTIVDYKEEHLFCIIQKGQFCSNPNKGIILNQLSQQDVQEDIDGEGIAK